MNNLGVTSKEGPGAIADPAKEKPTTRFPSATFEGAQVAALGLEKAKIDTEYCLSKVYVKVRSVERPTYGGGEKRVTVDLLHSSPAIEESQESGEDEESGEESGDEESESGYESEGSDEAATENETTGKAVRNALDFPTSSVSPAEAGL